jgi:uncharacterized protein YabN with tetrapyrrole methylase and pyrophosphatase domain
MTAHPKVYIIGAGIRGRRQLTLEALAHLQRAGAVLFFPQAGITEAWLTQVLGVPEAVDLTPYYSDGGRDRDNYSLIADVVANAARRVGTVCMLMPGHPRFGMTMTTMLDGDPRFADIAVRTVEGVSSFDTMLCDLRRDPLTHGSLAVDANRLLYYEIVLDPRVDTYVYHVCSVGTQATNWRNPQRANRLELLQRYLAQYFPADHVAILIESRGDSGLPPRLVRSPLDRLTEALPTITFSTTLFVPGTSVSRESPNRDFAALVGSD